MKYTLTGGGQRLDADDPKLIQSALHIGPFTLSSVELEIKLPIPLAGRVGAQPDPHERQQIELRSGDVVCVFDRKTAFRGDGDISVSCSPAIDSDSKVDTINLDFRDMDDQLTDRGLVWICPGEPAKARLTLRPNQFTPDSESVEAIIAAAEACMQQEVLRHFIR